MFLSWLHTSVIRCNKAKELLLKSGRNDNIKSNSDVPSDDVSDNDNFI
jgi:hypothetical protein